MSRPVVPEDVPHLVGVLSRAFAADPFLHWLVGPPTRHAKGFRHFYLEAFARTLPGGAVFTTEERDAAALWIPASAWAPGLLAEASTGFAIASSGAAWRVVSILRGLASIQRVHPREPHHYLMVLGVEPARQGQGVGSRLLQPMLQRCDHEGMGAYLETALKRDIDFYLRHGFEVTQPFRVAAGGPEMWGMWRKPASGRSS